MNTTQKQREIDISYLNDVGANVTQYNAAGNLQVTVAVHCSPTWTSVSYKIYKLGLSMNRYMCKAFINMTCYFSHC